MLFQHPSRLGWLLGLLDDPRGIERSVVPIPVRGYHASNCDPSARLVIQCGFVVDDQRLGSLLQGNQMALNARNCSRDFRAVVGGSARSVWDPLPVCPVSAGGFVWERRSQRRGLLGQGSRGAEADRECQQRSGQQVCGVLQGVPPSRSCRAPSRRTQPYTHRKHPVSVAPECARAMAWLQVPTRNEWLAKLQRASVLRARALDDPRDAQYHLIAPTACRHPSRAQPKALHCR